MLLINQSHCFELQFASLGQAFPVGMPCGMSSPSACFGVSQAGGNCDSGTCYRECWQLNASRIELCHIFINSGTVL